MTDSYAIIDRIEADFAGECRRPRTFLFKCRHCERLVRIKMGCGKRFDTFCEECARKWRHKTFKKYFAGIVEFQDPKFLTLTLRKTKGDMVKRLMMLWKFKTAAFKEIKRRGYKIRAWLGVIEPPNHIHMVIDAGFIPVHEISEIWETKTGDSYIVDIRKINAHKDPKQAAAYITKYLSKASAWDGINLDRLEGFHLIGSRGCPKHVTKALCVCGVKALMKMTAYDWFAEYDSLDLWSNKTLENKFGIWLKGKDAYS